MSEITDADIDAMRAQVKAEAFTDEDIDRVREGKEPLPVFLKQRGKLDADGNYTVETPLGPTRWSPEGVKIVDAEEWKQSQDLQDATNKEDALNAAVTFGSGASQKLVPQVAGLRAALPVSTSGAGSFLGPVGAISELIDQGPSATLDKYRAARDDAAKTVRAARESAGPGYEIAGALATSGPFAPESAGGRLALSGILGASNSLIESKADLTKPSAETLKMAATDAATGGGFGLAAGLIGEGLGAGLRKVAGHLEGKAVASVAKQAAKDEAAVAAEIASLKGKLGSETQSASRILENAQRAVAGTAEIGEQRLGAVGSDAAREAAEALSSPAAKDLAEKVLSNNLKDLPGKQAAIELMQAELGIRVANSQQEAARRTAEYFATPLFQSEVAPRLKLLAPRFGIAAAGYLAGSAFDAAAGTDSAKGIGGFVGATLGAQGVRQMIKNVASSPRVQKAIADRLTPILMNAAAVATAAPLLAVASHDVSESDLGDQELAAEGLTSLGGLASVVGKSTPTPSTPLGSELDQKIQRTVGVVQLGAALEQHNNDLEKGIDKVMKGERPPASPTKAVQGTQDFGGKRQRKDAKAAHDQHVNDLSSLATDPNVLLDRVASNLGDMSHIAPGVYGALVRHADRATKYLLEQSKRPPKAGPLAAEWHTNETERHLFAQKLEVVQDPMSVMRHAAAGTLTRAQMDALKATSPLLARQISDAALMRLADSPKGIPYRARMALSLLTGVDVDGTMGAAIAHNQAAIQGARGKAGDTQGAPSTPGSDSKITLAERTALPSQRRSMEA